MKKTVIIDENLREEIMDALQQENAYAQAIEKLSVSMAREKAKAWTIIYKSCPEATSQGLRSDLNLKTWELTYDYDEYTREGENMIEKIDEVDFDQAPTPTGIGNEYVEIDPELYEVHTPPPIGIGEGN